MAQPDHCAGPPGVPGKRLIVAHIIETFFILIGICTLAYIIVILHSFSFAIPSSFFIEFLAVLAATTLFISFTESSIFSGGVVA